jgi:hypothetical protein
MGMIDALAARGADPAATEPDLFGQFVGSWDLDVTYYPTPAETETSNGEWHFGWILEGRAIQDVFIVPRRGENGRHGSGHQPRVYGTTVRFFDPAIDAWRIVWASPLSGVQALFIGRRRDDEIVLENTDGGMIMHWVFSDIENNSFRWRAETSEDGGSTWRLVQEMTVRRRP